MRYWSVYRFIFINGIVLSCYLSENDTSYCDSCQNSGLFKMKPLIRKPCMCKAYLKKGQVSSNLLVIPMASHTFSNQPKTLFQNSILPMHMHIFSTYRHLEVSVFGVFFINQMPCVSLTNSQCRQMEIDYLYLVTKKKWYNLMIFIKKQSAFDFSEFSFDQ